MATRRRFGRRCVQTACGPRRRREIGRPSDDLLFRVGSHCLFAHGFAKSDKANVSAKEMKALKRLADILSEYSDAELIAAKAVGELVEVLSDGGDKEKD